MAYVVVISALFIVAAFAMFKKLGAANTAKLEAAVSSREEADQAKFAQPSRSFYARQFDEAVSCRH